MASCLEQLQLKYQGKSFERESGSKTATFVYIGSEELCRRAVEEDFQVGMEDPEYGTIESTSIQQGEGPFYELTVKYVVEYPDVDFDTDDSAEGSGDEPLHSELTVRIQQNPIETHPNYLRIWNYDLWMLTTGDPDAWPPQAYVNYMLGQGTDWVADDIYHPNGTTWYFMFSQFRPEEMTINNRSYAWHGRVVRTKPGVSTYDFPVYEMTQYRKVQEQVRCRQARLQ